MEIELPQNKLTSRHCLVATVWPHAVSVTTERHQAGYDSRLSKAHVSDDQHAFAAHRVAAAKTTVHFLKKPVSASKEPIRGEARNFKVEGLQVEGGGEADCWQRKTLGYKAWIGLSPSVGKH